MHTKNELILYRERVQRLESAIDEFLSSTIKPYTEEEMELLRTLHECPLEIDPDKINPLC